MASSTFGPFVNGTKVVASAGTALAIDSTTRVVRSVTITALSSNTGKIFYGGADVDSSTQVGLDPGESKSFSRTPDARGRGMTFDSAELFIDAAVTGEGVDFEIDLDEEA
jgi:hypothetical protein